jgi:hypothetical protein
MSREGRARKEKKENGVEGKPSLEAFSNFLRRNSHTLSATSSHSCHPSVGGTGSPLFHLRVGKFFSPRRCIVLDTLPCDLAEGFLTEKKFFFNFSTIFKDI